jgi:hypothetical protein
MVFHGITKQKGCIPAALLLVGRGGFEPSTNGLKVGVANCLTLNVARAYSHGTDKTQQFPAFSICWRFTVTCFNQNSF